MFIASRSYVSLTHLVSADYFAQQCILLESKLERPSKRIIGIEFTSKECISQRALVTGTIFSIIAFLEATINEIFQDANEEINGYIINFSLETRKNMNIYWEKNKFRAKTLDKYQELLRILNIDNFDRGKDPFQGVSNLIKLRNYLTHYNPEWFRTSVVHQLEKNFRNKFDYSKLSIDSDPFFPDKILGAGFANWTVKKCLEFTNDFYERVRLIEPVYKYLEITY